MAPPFELIYAKGLALRMIQAPALPTGEISAGNGAGASGVMYWMLQLGGSIRKTGRFVPQRSIVTPIRSAVLDKSIDDLLLFIDKVNCVSVVDVEVTQGACWNLNSRILRKRVQLIKQNPLH
jgi:hypothetical protein|tara:strand:- start:1081 stop:1446 length:366 start_codon:yes stop_codon:yes gene_type:complete